MFLLPPSFLYAKRGKKLSEASAFWAGVSFRKENDSYTEIYGKANDTGSEPSLTRVDGTGPPSNLRSAASLHSSRLGCGVRRAAKRRRRTDCKIGAGRKSSSESKWLTVIVAPAADNRRFTGIQAVQTRRWTTGMTASRTSDSEHLFEIGTRNARGGRLGK